MSTTVALRRKNIRRFRGLQKYSDYAACGVLLIYVIQIFAGFGVGYYAILLEFSAASAALLVAAQLFIATRLRGLNNIVHECSHATFCDSRSENERIGKLCASLTLGCFQDYREEHLSHHMHLGDYEKDKDFQGIKDLRLDEPLSTKVVVRHFFTPFLGRHLRYYVNINLSERDGRVYQALKVFLVFATFVFSVVKPELGVFLLIVPYLFFYSALNYWADCMDHAGLVGSSEEIDSSRNLAVPVILRVVFFPRNDSFHLVHHLFPQVPARHLDKAHEALLEDPEYSMRSNACPSSGLLAALGGAFSVKVLGRS